MQVVVTDALTFVLSAEGRARQELVFHDHHQQTVPVNATVRVTSDGAPHAMARS